jgi:hypothetical protein
MAARSIVVCFFCERGDGSMSGTPELRDSLIRIYTRHFAREPRRQHFGEYERSRALTLRATFFRSAMTWQWIRLDLRPEEIE